MYGVLLERIKLGSAGRGAAESGSSWRTADGVGLWADGAGENRWTAQRCGVCVATTLADGAVRKLPPTRFEFLRLHGDAVRASPWRAGWGVEDVEGDGHPGITVTVDSTLCGGELHVGSTTTSAATGHLTEDGMVGLIDVRVQQQIHGADGYCLSVASSDTDERQRGRLAYKRVPPSTTCESLQVDQWPARAEVRP